MGVEESDAQTFPLARTTKFALANWQDAFLTVPTASKRIFALTTHLSRLVNTEESMEFAFGTAINVP